MRHRKVVTLNGDEFIELNPIWMPYVWVWLVVDYVVQHRWTWHLLVPTLAVASLRMSLRLRKISTIGLLAASMASSGVLWVGLHADQEHASSGYWPID